MTEKEENSFDNDFEFYGDVIPTSSLKSAAFDHSISVRRVKNEECVLVRLSDLAQYNISVNDIQASGMVFNSDHQKWEETEKCPSGIDLTGFESSKASHCSWDEEFGFVSAGDLTPRPLLMDPNTRKFLEDDEISDLCMAGLESEEHSMTTKPAIDSDYAHKLAQASLKQDDDWGNEYEGIKQPEGTPITGASSGLKIVHKQPDMDIDLDGFSDNSGDDVDARKAALGPDCSNKIGQKEACDPQEHNYDDDFDDDFTSDGLSGTLQLSAPSTTESQNQQKVGEFLRNLFKGRTEDGDEVAVLSGDLPSGAQKDSGVDLKAVSNASSKGGPRLIKPEELQRLIAAGDVSFLKTQASAQEAGGIDFDDLSDFLSETHTTSAGGGTNPSCTWDGSSELAGSDAIENWDDGFEGDLSFSLADIHIPTNATLVKSSVPTGKKKVDALSMSSLAIAHNITKKDKPKQPTRGVPSKKLRLITPDDVSLTAVGGSKGQQNALAIAPLTSVKERSKKPVAPVAIPETELLMRFDSVQQKWVNRTDISSAPLEDIDWDDDDGLSSQKSGAGSARSHTPTVAAGSMGQSTTGTGRFLPSQNSGRNISSQHTTHSSTDTEGSPLVTSTHPLGRESGDTDGDSTMLSGFIARDLSASDDVEPSLSSRSYDKYERTSQQSEFIVNEELVGACANRHDIFMRAFLRDMYGHLVGGGAKNIDVVEDKKPRRRNRSRSRSRSRSRRGLNRTDSNDSTDSVTSATNSGGNDGGRTKESIADGAGSVGTRSTALSGKGNSSSARQIGDTHRQSVPGRGRVGPGPASPVRGKSHQMESITTTSSLPHPRLATQGHVKPTEGTTTGGKSGTAKAGATHRDALSWQQHSVAGPVVVRHSATHTAKEFVGSSSVGGTAGVPTPQKKRHSSAGEGAISGSGSSVVDSRPLSGSYARSSVKTKHNSASAIDIRSRLKQADGTFDKEALKPHTTSKCSVDLDEELTQLETDNSAFSVESGNVTAVSPLKSAGRVEGKDTQRVSHTTSSGSHTAQQKGEGSHRGGNSSVVVPLVKLGAKKRKVLSDIWQVSHFVLYLIVFMGDTDRMACYYIVCWSDIR